MRLQSLAVAAASYFAYAREQEDEQAALLPSSEEVVTLLNVAIIGAGAGGASSAYHLAKFAANASVPINITIFERNSTVGGRCTTVNAYDDDSLPIELGASIFVKVNSILNDAVAEFNLSTTDSLPDEVDVPGPGLGVWDGEKFVVTLNGGWKDTAKLLWKYGLAPVRTMRLMRKVVGQFLKMYEAPVFPFEDLAMTAGQLGLLDVTATTGDRYLEANGITGPFAHDVVQASTRVNYASNLRHIHGLETMVCMAAEGGSQVQGGNWQIFAHMITASNATKVFDTEVSAIEKAEDGGYTLETSSSKSKPEAFDTTSQHFDTVILAAPYQFTDLKLPSDVKNEDIPDKIPYVKLHTTLFTSPHLLSPAYFNLTPGENAPRSILTTLPEGEETKRGKEGVGSPGFFSISLLRPMTNPGTGCHEYAYKIFSAEPPNGSFFAGILGLENPDSDGKETESGVSEKDVTWIYRKLWRSYPYEWPRVTFERVRLGEGVWYTGAMDSFISAMESNALMGMNVARLVVDERARGVSEAGMRKVRSRAEP